MAQTVRDVMTPNPTTCPSQATLVDAAERMRDSNIGTILVTDGDRLAGIVTDRDIVVRGVASGQDPRSMHLGDVCSGDLMTLQPNSDLDQAIQMMRQKALRRVPVVESGKPVGIVSIGDLAMERDEQSALADISAAKPNR